MKEYKTVAELKKEEQADEIISLFDRLLDTTEGARLSELVERMVVDMRDMEKVAEMPPMELEDIIEYLHERVDDLEYDVRTLTDRLDSIVED